MASSNTPLDDLFKVDLEFRDADWEESFFKSFLRSNVKVVFSDPKPGPDGWPYLFVETTKEADEPVSKIVSWLAERGIGLALNIQKPMPDFVFTYGMLWNYRERGEFLSTAPKIEAGEIRLGNGEQVFIGEPSEIFLPKYVRAILKQFFFDQGVHGVKTMMMSKDQKHYDLCFSLESLGNPPEKERAGIAEAIAWFLPAHYSVALLSEKAVEGFKPL